MLYGWPGKKSLINGRLAVLGRCLTLRRPPEGEGLADGEAHTLVVFESSPTSAVAAEELSDVGSAVDGQRASCWAITSRSGMLCFQCKFLIVA